jgi:hypothetical protein
MRNKAHDFTGSNIRRKQLKRKTGQELSERTNWQALERQARRDLERNARAISYGT